MDVPTRHQLLRDRRHWLGQGAGTSVDREGDLTLARVPAPADGRPVEIAATFPCGREASGLAVGPCGALFVADTANDRILYVDGLCGARSWLPADATEPLDLPGHFDSPRGLAFGADALGVADSGNGRIQHLALPALEAHLAWPGWSEPTSIALDGLGRMLVCDAVTRRVRRVASNGDADEAFDARIAAQGRLASPLFVACGVDDRVLVSDAGADAVFVFDAEGTFVGSLPGPSGWFPGALATFAARVYVADAADGAIRVFDDDTLTGAVAGWRGPVTALAVSDQGDLYVKPDLLATWHCFAADAAFVAQGERTAGPFDAGEDRCWERAWVDGDVPPGATLDVDVVLQDVVAAPNVADWRRLPASDALLATVDPAGRRHAWIRLTFTRASAAVAPRIVQARMATAAEDYLDHLPLTYRLNDGADGFLSRWLKLVRGEFGRIEEAIDAMARLADPRFATHAALPWLAQWLAFELPQIADDDERRALVERAVALLARRGTPASIAGFVAMHTGIEPAVIEAFPERRIWSLGASSTLGFDTRLAPLDPNGMVVADEDVGTGCCKTLAEARTTCTGSSSTASGPGGLTGIPIGHAVVGESGPLARHQIGLPLFADTAFRFCVVVDSYRVRDRDTLQEITRIVEREKPAHTDYRLELVAPELRVGLQARIGIDAIVGRAGPSLRVDATRLGIDTHLPRDDIARIGSALLDGTLNLS